MKIKSYRTTPRGSEINLVPLLDVVFSILAFFILLSASLVTSPRVGLDLPQSNRNNNNQFNVQQKDMLVITLDRTGQTRIDNRALSQSSIETEIRAYMAKFPQGLVVLNAEDSNVTYQQVINRLEELRKIAGNRVAIATSRS